MLKFSLIAAVLAVACNLSFAQDKKSEKRDDYVYQPKIEIKKIPDEQMHVSPAPPGVEDGIGVACLTLRGRGVGAVIMGGQVVYFVIDCPVQPMNDVSAKKPGD